MRTIEAGDEGDDVKTVQRILGIPEDGDFGPMTDAAVQAFQAAAGLEATGVVDEMTWEELHQLDRRKSKAVPRLEPALQASILAEIHGAPLFHYSWDDRGIAPAGYINGMALTFALLVRMYNDGDGFVRELAKAPAGDEDDALVVYEAEFAALKMDNSATGLTTLRHLFVLMIGLGMRESSGKYYEGRDMTAENVESGTAEAGLFQTSWNINTCSDEFMDELLRSYWLDPNGWLPVFGEGLVPNADGLEHYGSGDGARYQFLAKYAPAFAVLVTALGLRLRCDHWGPINRGEAELTPEADELLRRVQAIVCTYA
jgi:peptidoglycan hydrolase-like protein with peptidoglycan-binding domain